jgi:hypothetical protein
LDLWNWRGKQTISTQEQDIDLKTKGPLAIVKNVSKLNYISLFHTLYFTTLFITKETAFGVKQAKLLDNVSLSLYKDKDIKVEHKVRVNNNLSKLVDAKVENNKSKEKIANGGRSNKCVINLSLLKNKIEPKLTNEQAYEANRNI